MGEDQVANPATSSEVTIAGTRLSVTVRSDASLDDVSARALSLYEAAQQTTPVGFAVGGTNG